MKVIKSIVTCGLLLLGVGAAITSCEDSFTAENKLVTTNLQPQDTLYQMMGIVKRMQKLADRTVLLGEVRADLVDVNPAVASTDLQQLSNNTISTDNVYNKPADYYAVINNCNIYLAYVDSLLKSHGEVYYEKEICAAKCFRAWCYLELAKIYGSVPFVTEPVLTADDAEDIVASGTKADMATILDFCINDLQKYPYMDENDALRPSYGNSFGFVTNTHMFIPVRALLAELYLWRGTYTNSQADYINAIRMYHDFFCFPSEERGVGSFNIAWIDRDHRGWSSSYANRFGITGLSGSVRSSGAASSTSVPTQYENAGVLVCDTVQYYGNTSDLRMIFNSQYSNNYYPWVSPSQRIRDISADQDYCFYAYTSATIIDTIYMSKDPNDYTSMSTLGTSTALYVGDLRLSRIYSTSSNLAESKYNSNVSDTKYFIAKWLDGSSSISTDVKNSYIPFYRTSILYLHMAEALNRAGFPETAYAILKYGLSYNVMNNRSIISQDEFDRLCEIKSYGFSLSEPKYSGDIATQANNSFVIWRSNVFDNPDKNQASLGGMGGGNSMNASSEASLTQIGIHSFGSGDTEYNEKYYLDDAATLANVKAHVAIPDTVALGKNSTAEDSIAWKESVDARDAAIAQNAEIDAANAAYLAQSDVREKRQARVAQLILEEEALEGAFEGLRFYDIMRYQMQEKGGTGIGSTITLPDYIEEKYQATPRMTGKPWYLPLPKR